jgi:hypothetical protein
MAATLDQSTVQDFATEIGIVQSPRSSLDDSPSFVYLHATCRKCHHWYNKHKIPNPFPRYQKFDLECPKCHKKLFRVGTQSSQDSFMTQETDIPSDRPPSINLASIQSVLDSDSPSSSRIRPNARRVPTEASLGTLFAEPINDEEAEDVASESLDNPEGDSEEMRPELQLDLLGIHALRDSAPVFNQPIQDIDDANAMDEVRLAEQDLTTAPGGMINERIPEGPHSSSLGPPVSTLTNEASVLKARRHRLTKGKIRSLSRKVSLFVKNKVGRILSFGTRRRITPDAQPSENSATTVPAEGTVDEIDPEAFGPHEAPGPQETAPTLDVALQTANVTNGQHPGLIVPPTGPTRTRSISAPEEILQPSEGVSTALTKDEYRRELREEKTRQAKERELQHRRCPCWPHCECYPDGARRLRDRAHTMPSKPLICISSVRDGLRNDEFYREIQHLAQQVRTQRADRGSSDGTSQAGPSADHAPSQAPTWDSLGTTISGNPLSYGSTASIEGDSFPPPGIATNPLINTDLIAETLGDEDQAHTPRQTDYADEILMHVGGQHDSDNADTDGANQRN